MADPKVLKEISDRYEEIFRLVEAAGFESVNEAARWAAENRECFSMLADSLRKLLCYIEDLELRLRGAEATTAAARDVLAERRRQVEAEGWTPDHDDEHAPGEMSQAAACYAKYGDWVAYRNTAPNDWPWHESWWKPSDSRRNLVKAAALILAEIERLDRIKTRKAGIKNDS